LGNRAEVIAMMDTLPLVQLGRFIKKRTEFVTIDDLIKYRRTRVQLHGKGIVHRDELFGSEIKTKQQQVLRQGELLIAEIDAKVGGFGIVPAELEGAIVSSHYFVFEINEQYCLREWLEWFIRSGLLEDQVAAQGSTNYAAIRPSHVLEYTIPLPPIPDQQRIVARIEVLARLVEEAQLLKDQVLVATTNLISSLHTSWAKRHTVNLSNIIRLDEDRVQIMSGQAYPQVGVKGFGEGLFAKEAVRGEETTYRFFNRLYDGAIVLSQVKGWEGAIAVCPPALAGRFVSPEYRTFRCIPDQALPRYLSTLFETPWFWNQLKSLTRGVGGRRERIRPEVFLRLELPMPTLDKQRGALDVFEKLRSLRPMHRTAQLEVVALMPSILAKAFAAEL
jgi:type I restriction enzyme, S subunit